MAIEVFNRQELKFVITKAQYMSMLPEITRHMRLDIHNTQGQAYRLSNLYIDTEDRALIRHSTTKPVVYKEKLRPRSYRPFHEGGVVFFEVKKRYKRITSKPIPGLKPGAFGLLHAWLTGSVYTDGYVIPSLDPLTLRNSHRPRDCRPKEIPPVQETPGV